MSRTLWCGRDAAKFACATSQLIEFEPLGLNTNVAIVVRLDFLAPPGRAASPLPGPAPSLVVGNTHILFNPKRWRREGGR